MTKQGLHSTSLEKLCRQQGEPFIQLSPGDAARELPLRSLKETIDVLYRSTAMYCGHLRDVVVFGKSYITDEAGKAVFFNQSHKDYDRNEFTSLYRDQIVQESRPHPVVEQECCFLGGWLNFGHFLFEYLFRLAAFDMAGVLDRFPVVVYEDIPDGWVSFIELYGVPKERILRIPRHPAPRFKSVWITACPNGVNQKREYTFWDDGIRSLRDKLREKAAQFEPKIDGPKRIFLGRKDAAHRRVLNEGEVWQLLRARGFERPDLHGLSAAEQIRTVASADVIVSIIGGGSPITCFAPDTASIVEMRPPSITGGLGSKGFAAILGQTFTPLKGEVVKYDAARPKIDQDIEVDLELLRSYVDSALNQ